MEALNFSSNNKFCLLVKHYGAAIPVTSQHFPNVIAETQVQ